MKKSIYYDIRPYICNICCPHFRSKNGKTPAKFGRYQRNIFTFTQSCILFAIYQFLLSISVIILLVLSITEQPVKISFYFVLLYYLILDIAKNFLIPLIIIKRSLSTLPELFSSDSAISEVDHFYVRRPDLLPRHVNTVPKDKNLR